MIVSKRWAVGLSTAALAAALSPVATGIAGASTASACSKVTGPDPAVQACIQLDSTRVTSYGIVYDGSANCKAVIKLYAGASVIGSDKVLCPSPDGGRPMRVTGPSAVAEPGTSYHSTVTVYPNAFDPGPTVSSPIVTAR